MKLVYQGSVKNLWEVNDRTLEFEFTDAFSVFDWGRMSDDLPGKGEALCAIGTYFFERLTQKKIPNHFLNRSGPARFQVERAGDSESLRFIPLEVVFRFGVPEGSSLLERLQSAKPWDRFAQPIVEFFTKFEDTDRLLSKKEAQEISKVPAEVFTRLVPETIRVAEVIQSEFDRIGLELWDGKLEWGWSQARQELVLVDSIGPDELRLLLPGTRKQLSKEYLRAFYRKTPWFQKLLEAKENQGLRWREWVLENAGHPPKLESDVFQAAAAMYPSIAFALCGENPKSLAKPLTDFSKFL